MKKLILIICFALLSGCSVSNDDITFANTVCEKNGGISFIRNGGNLLVKCNNGAIFYKK